MQLAASVLSPIVSEPKTGGFSASLGLPIILIAVVVLIVAAVVFFIRRRQ